MLREGHVGAALVAYAPLGALTLALGFDQLALLGGVGAAGLAMLPDVDVRIPLVPHRGPTHTVWFALLVGVLLGAAGVVVGGDRGPLAAVGLGAWGFALGAGTVGSHVLADALTPAGVRPFAPLRDREYSLELVRAGNPIANYLLLAVGVGAVAVGLGLGSRGAELLG